MLGYLNKPEATAETLDADGFLHTGDIGVYHEGDYFSIVDRVKELIKYKGYQIAPAELEALLLSHPAVLDAAVIGVLDDDKQEIPKAFIVPAPGSGLTEDGRSWRSSPRTSLRTRRSAAWSSSRRSRSRPRARSCARTCGRGRPRSLRRGTPVLVRLVEDVEHIASRALQPDHRAAGSTIFRATDTPTRVRHNGRMPLSTPPNSFVNAPLQPCAESRELGEGLRRTTSRGDLASRRAAVRDCRRTPRAAEQGRVPDLVVHSCGCSRCSRILSRSTGHGGLHGALDLGAGPAFRHLLASSGDAHIKQLRSSFAFARAGVWSSI